MKDEKKEIKIADLFGGVGGFRLGIEKAQDNRSEFSLSEGWNKNPRSSQNLQREGNNSCPQARCIFYCDHDKYAVQTYNKNFGENHKPTDIINIRAEDIPDFDMLCGGFPCQAFSIAGKRGGFQDTRGTLFFEIARIIKAKRPKLIFLENVKGLLNHNKGETFSIIIQTISELGYNVQWMVLNSKFFGVPQNRERVFIIGSLRGEPRPEILPFGNFSSEINEEYGKPKIIGTTKSDTAKGTNSRSWVHDVSGIIGAVNSTEYKQPKQIMIDVYNKKLRGECPTLSDPCHNAIRVAQIHSDRSPDMKIRKLTPIECERLQGFPDNWTEGVSDTQRYKQMGNAVTVNVIEAIARKLI